ncbi:MAG: SPOR domain-containing protein [Pseudomonadota bacterium]
MLSAIGVAWYLKKTPGLETGKPTAPAQTEAEKSKPREHAKLDAAMAKPEARPRFDFYKILPGTEERAAEPNKPGQPQLRENVFLQAGAFQNAADADNLKAHLALLGLEASIQTTALPDKGVWHRVRLGPFAKAEDIEHTRTTLKQAGIEPVLLKVREPVTPPQ